MQPFRPWRSAVEGVKVGTVNAHISSRRGEVKRSLWRGRHEVSGAGVKLGLRDNWFQFSLFTVITLFIGMTIGVERVALPPLARDQFGIVSVLYTVSFLAAFGLVKSIMNLVSGRLSDRRGRKALLVAGWLFAIPYALLIIFATSWWYVLAANLLLGVNQGLTWTMSVTAKIDLVGPVNRGLAVGIDESAGYIGVGLGGIAAGLLVAKYGLRPAPYLLVLAVVVVGLLVTVLFAKDTLPWTRIEGTSRSGPHLRRLEIFKYMSYRDRSMLAVCQAGMINKFLDSLVAAFLPLYFLRLGVGLLAIGTIAGTYALVWGFGQLGGGAIADRYGRRLPIVAGTFTVGGGLAVVLVTVSYPVVICGAVLMGLGMALVYPNLITVVGDTADPAWRGSALGVYRLWRDGGYALGPVVLGVIASFFGLVAALWAGVGLAAASGLVLATSLVESDPKRRLGPRKWETHPEWLGAASRSELP